MIRPGALQQMMLDAISGDNDDEILEGEWTQRWFQEFKNNFPLLFDIWCISFEYSVSQLVLYVLIKWTPALAQISQMFSFAAQFYVICYIARGVYEAKKNNKRNFAITAWILF